MTYEKKTIVVRSFDFDGCIFTNGYIQKQGDTNATQINKELLFKSNENFFELLLAESKYDKPSEIHYLLGTNRQSFAIDQGNSRRNKSGSAFEAFKLITDFLIQKTDPTIVSKVNGFLLADIFGEKPNGYNYTVALKTLSKAPLESDEKCTISPFEHSKIILLYAQMHMLAAENPEAEVIVEFFDDRFFPEEEEDLIVAINTFFEKHPELIPHNVRLRTHGYEGPIPKDLRSWFNQRKKRYGSRLDVDQKFNDRAAKAYVTRAKTIRGTGFINPAYKTSILKLFQDNDFILDDNKLENVIKRFEENPSILQNFKEQSRMDALSRFKQEIDFFPNNTTLHKALRDLYTEILENQTFSTSKGKIVEETLCFIRALKKTKNSTERLQLIESYRYHCSLEQINHTSLYLGTVNAFMFTDMVLNIVQAAIDMPNLMTANRKEIIVHSFDADDCLFNIEYIQKQRAFYADVKLPENIEIPVNEKLLFETNEAFLTHLLKEIHQEKPDEVHYIIGSNRQSPKDDCFNSNNNKTGSIFPAFKLITDFLINKTSSAIQSKVDGFLLADIYDNKPHGYHYDTALKALNKAYDKKLTLSYFDDSKIMLFLVQMHKIANENRNARINFNVYDDKFLPGYETDIVNNLGDFFGMHPELIPHNVHLRVHGYEGPIPQTSKRWFLRRLENFGSKLAADIKYNQRAISAGVTRARTIQGTGLIDANYEQSIRAFFQNCNTDTTNALEEFKKNPALLHDLKSNISSGFLTVFRKKIDHYASIQPPLYEKLSTFYNIIINEHQLSPSIVRLLEETLFFVMAFDNTDNVIEKNELIQYYLQHSIPGEKLHLLSAKREMGNALVGRVWEIAQTAKEIITPHLMQTTTMISQPSTSLLFTSQLVFLSTLMRRVESMSLYRTLNRLPAWFRASTRPALPVANQARIEDGNNEDNTLLSKSSQQKTNLKN